MTSFIVISPSIFEITMQTSSGNVDVRLFKLQLLDQYCGPKDRFSNMWQRLALQTLSSEQNINANRKSMHLFVCSVIKTNCWSHHISIVNFASSQLTNFVCKKFVVYDDYYANFLHSVIKTFYSSVVSELDFVVIELFL